MAKARNIALASGLVWVLASSPLSADDSITVAMPFSGTYSLIGEQFMDGLELSPAADDFLFERVDTACRPEEGASGSEQIPETADVVVGFICVDALDAALQTKSLQDKTLLIPFTPPLSFAPTVDQSAHPQMIHLASPTGSAALALAEYLVDNEPETPIAIIDDGTLIGRAFAAEVEIQLRDRNVEPVYTTNYRPQLNNQVALARLLARSGAQITVVGGDAFDVSRIDAAIDVIDADMVFAGGPLLQPTMDEFLLPEGTLVSALPNAAEIEYGEHVFSDAEEALVPVEGFFHWGFLTGEMLTHLRNRTLSAGLYQTSFGSLMFDDGGRLSTNLYRVSTVENVDPASDLEAEPE
ncbi:MAG: ABC transporter substrate-binding protein [Pseudomonadota bacterium]